MQIERVHEDGSVVFQNGKTILADVIMHCTGYKYHFPFLETNGIISVDDNRVGPLYKHIFLHHLYQRSLHRYNMEGTEKWRKEMCLTSLMRKMAHPETYRDEWEDHHLVSQAYQDFSLYTHQQNMRLYVTPVTFEIVKILR
ncbi:BnaUnng00410D [Brassica napus]|uniref:Flavin-containing monooxygenase n=3 Tax=Brassica TaxID=3705 RepID=A0A078GQN3_BRANA|nr:BnaUnng00410D [Brassica napus]VDD12113.1 unnamed protein product [Brassica oleracea]